MRLHHYLEPIKNVNEYNLVDSYIICMSFKIKPNFETKFSTEPLLHSFMKIVSSYLQS